MYSGESIPPCVAVVDGCWAVITLGYNYNILYVSGVLTNIVNGGAFFSCCIPVCI